MSSWFIEGLPETVQIEGTEFRIKSGFRALLLIDRILKDERLSAEDRMTEALSVFYDDNLPDDLAAATERLRWFQRCGIEEDDEEDRKESKVAGHRLKEDSAKAIDFDRDSGFIYASFLEAYGIDLTDRSLNLHWWKFSMLLESLPEDSRLSRIIYYRKADLSGMSKAQKKHILKMRGIYSLDKPDTKKKQQDDAKKKLMARNRRMIDYVNARFRETGTTGGE